MQTKMYWTLNRGPVRMFSMGLQLDGWTAVGLVSGRCVQDSVCLGTSLMTVLDTLCLAGQGQG